MSEVEQKRSEWGISKDAWHWQLYAYWRRLGGRGPISKDRPIDLCHYMRVVMFWVWLRWFFCNRFMPWAWTLGALVVAFNYWAFTMWPDAMIEIYVFIGIVLGILVASAGLIIGLVLAFDTGGAKRFGRWLERVPGAACGRVFISFRDHVAAPLGRGIIRLSFVMARPIWWRITPLVLLVCFIFAGIVYLLWGVAGTFLVILMWIGIALALALLIVGLIWATQQAATGVTNWRARAKHDAYRGPVELVPAKPSQFKMSMKLLWMYLRAKKHRVCPFIVPEDTPVGEQ